MASATFKAAVLLLVSYVVSVEAQVFRSACRRDALMKLTDRNVTLTGTAYDIISRSRVSGVRSCVKLCLKENKCLSINYREVASTAQGNNCQLLNLTKAIEGASLTNVTGWMHYEPMNQVYSLIFLVVYKF